MRFQIEVDERVVSEIEQLRVITGSADYKELFNNTIQLLSWAVQQRIGGRTVASLDEQQKEFRRLRMPALEFAAFAAGQSRSDLKAA